MIVVTSLKGAEVLRLTQFKTDSILRLFFVFSKQKKSSMYGLCIFKILFQSKSVTTNLSPNPKLYSKIISMLNDSEGLSNSVARILQWGRGVENDVTFNHTLYNNKR